MAGIRKPKAEQTIEALDRQLILKGAQNIDEIFKFKDSVGTPARNYIMARIKALYTSAFTSSSNEMIDRIDTWTLARGLINKVRKEGIEKNRTRGIWYQDHRMDFFGITDEKVKKNADSVAAIMLKDNLIEDKKGIFKIKVKNYGEVFNLWDGEIFRDQPIAAGPMCTGFLVEKDVIATAAHFVNEKNVKNLRFAFGFRMLSSKSPVIRIPGKDIYKGIKIKDRVLSLSDGTDYALVRLDRKVESRGSLKLSGEGITNAQEIYVIGHPCGLPLKYAPGAKVRYFNDIFFGADLDVYMGSSGSPVFSCETHEVIGMVSHNDTRDFRWTGKGWASFVYPNREIKASFPQCTIFVSGFEYRVPIKKTDAHSTGAVEEGQTSSPNESEKSRKQIFISYSHSDKKAVNRLTNDLENAGKDVWLDEKEIGVGDSISKKIEEGISQCDLFCLVISGHSVKSEWVKREYQTALNKQLSSGKPVLLPLLIDDVELPLLLSDIKYADFSGDYENGREQLLKAVEK